ncbi:MAG: hypothetical protein U0893_13770 [Chloroflexota bacterium]
MVRTAALLVVAGLCIFVLSQAGGAALAQDAPPDVGPAVLENALTEPGLLRAFTSPTGRCSGQFANDGYTLTTSGGCQAPTQVAVTNLNIRGLTMADGEVRVDLRPLNKMYRTIFQLWIRFQGDTDGQRYYVAVNPVNATVQLTVRSNGKDTVLSERTDLAGVYVPDDWNTVSLRAQGSNLWVLINGQPAVSATDSAFDRGGVVMLLSRVGPPDPSDTEEASVAIRNLRVAPLAGADQTRAPAYTPPP